MNHNVCRGFRRSSLIVPFLLIAISGCRPPAASRPEAIRPVKTAVVTAGDQIHQRTFPGKVEAAKRVELGFQVPGLLVDLPVREGQKVKKDELIAQLRQDEFQARLTTLQSQLDQARAGLQALRAGERTEERMRREAAVRAAGARLANARAEFERASQLLPTRAISRADFDAAEAAYHVAQEDQKAAVQLLEKSTIGRAEDIEAQEAQVRGLEARVVEANLNLRDSTLHAPYDGVIAKRFVEQNQNVRAKEPIVRFQDAEEIEVLVDVPEVVMAADLRAADILELAAEFSAAPGLRFPVQIREVAQQADSTTQTFQVRAAFPAPQGVRLLPGMTATVDLTYRRAGILGDRIEIPISAIYKDAAGESIVWLMGSDQTVKRRPVKLGTAAGGRVEIVNGLSAGERIAVAGVTQLRDGMKVRDLGDGLGGGQP